MAYQDIRRARVLLTRLFTESQVPVDMFSDSLLAETPAWRIRQVRDELTRVLGEFVFVEAAEDGHRIVCEQGVVSANAVIDSGGARFRALRIRSPRLSFNDMSDAFAALATLPGRSSVLVLEARRELASVRPDAPMAVGSVFKLAVLCALADQIRSGRRTWSEVVHLREHWRSLPSGVLQEWPAESPLTLYTLAALMISESDNTATDALIKLLGRRVVERYGQRNHPFLTTREAFVLKGRTSHDIRARYATGDSVERMSMIRRAQRRPLPAPDGLADERTFEQVEWFFTARELCDLMDRIGELELMTINAGPAERADWARVAYKGGSEPGVLSIAHRLGTRDGRTYLVSATWNYEHGLDQGRLLALYNGMLEVLKSLPAAPSRSDSHLATTGGSELPS